MAPHPAAPAHAGPAGRSVQAPDGARTGIAAHSDADGPHSSVLGEGRHRPRHLQRRPRCAQPGRAALPGRRDRKLGRNLRADLLHRLDRRTDPRRPAHFALPAPATPVAGLLRAESHRRHHQPADERRRGTRPARHRGRNRARQEHALADRLGRHSLLPRLAARSRGPRCPARDGGRHRALPLPLRPCLPGRARAPRASHGDARRGHRRDPRPAVVHAGAGEHRTLPRSQ